MAILDVVKASSKRGRKLLGRLERRGDGLLDAHFLDRAGKVVEAVREGGDRALLKAVRRYDGVPAEEIWDLQLVPGVEAADDLPAGFEEALERAIVAVERYHQEQVFPGYRLAEGGVELVERRRPLRRVGVYVPGGRASYPSTAVMTVIPAKIAGVREIVVATPPGSWEASPALRFTLERLGVREVWGMGGAHAVAALAHGTESIPRVDKIVGPGNVWVTAAKHLVSGEVAIDGLAGPSEVVIVASGDDADPALLAADLLAQAEHDPQAMALLLTDRRRTAKGVRREVREQVKELGTGGVAARALRSRGGAVVVRDVEEALEWVEALAPEHLQLVGGAAEGLAERVENAAAIFVGAATPVAFGDYLAGPSHVLPTHGTARFASGLGVEDFVRRSHLVRFDHAASHRVAAAVSALATVEGLPAHAASAHRRHTEEG